MVVRLLAVVISLAAILTSLVAWATGAWGASVLGGGLSLLGGVAALFLLRRGLLKDPDGPKGLLGAFVAAMLLRMLLLGVGLVVAAAVLDLEPLPFVFAFFAVYFPTLVVEVVFVQRAGRRRAMAS